jgi:hypothetical protein
MIWAANVEKRLGQRASLADFTRSAKLKYAKLAIFLPTETRRVLVHEIVEDYRTWSEETAE